MFKISSKSPNLCCGFERDRHYTFEEIQRILPSCYEIPNGIDDSFNGAFTITRRLEWQSFSREVPVLIFESEVFSLEEAERMF